MKTILGCDLSLSCPAFSVVTVHNGTATVIKMYHVKTDSKMSLGQRLYKIYSLADEIYKTNEIDVVVMEKGFSRHAVATQQLQRVVGVFLLTSFYYGFEKVEELAPTTVKKHITGSGKASKEELELALYTFVGNVKYANNDESDATGVAVAYAEKKGWL
jgi:crossover junction endodeoxyribonuclease RuvC